MKVIDLLTAISNGCDVPNKIEVCGNKYNLGNEAICYENETNGDDLLELSIAYPTNDLLNFEVHIIVTDKDIKKNEIDIDSIEELGIGDSNLKYREKTNELIKAVKQLNKKIGDNK